MRRTNPIAISIAIAASLGISGAFDAACKGATANVDGDGLVVGCPLDGQSITVCSKTK